MNSYPVVGTITMEDGGQSEGASATTFYAARELALAALAWDDAASGKKASALVTPAPAAPRSYDKTQDISYNCC